ncbi:class I SAM-dependent methyltransferase [Actinoplanes friuliensis]|uniref:Ubiquinone/menaquinone biosynthesis methyltransferase ubiE n=1 Tax=Actinoplanes friuliensis DSM 7358 TaxID=1246995 RepID=U5VX12_9ACTN|nr:class I SAM-dependent methyltransferase [Actinoplanes friuliensis]AGZ41409.1 ubiquinone/menaquinone biosynthesis methyltransferase ubiE [Actinoplanes friuliensis DSM 7358]
MIDEDTLLGSAVVANNAMNRERQLTGANSYAKELGFDPVDLLGENSAWLDLCCGSGRALIQAATRVRAAALVGVDLVDAFDPVPGGAPPELICAPLLSWTPNRTFDLITCVHGLHYVGDKLAALGRAASWLSPGGRLVADLDLSAIDTGEPTTRRLASRLRAAGFTYDARRRRISRTGPAVLNLPYVYLGADDRAGPNYTGQPAVRSHYRVA